MSDYDLIDALLVCAAQDINEETQDILKDYTNEKERKAVP